MCASFYSKALARAAFAGLLTFAGALGTAQGAALLSYDDTVAHSTRDAGGNYMVGNQFKVTTSSGLMVTDLGVQGESTGPVPVGIWSWNGTTATLLTDPSLTVSISDPLGAGGYHYHALAAPLALNYGQEYLIGAWLKSVTFEQASAAGLYTFDASKVEYQDTLLNDIVLSGGLTDASAPTPLGFGSAVVYWGAANALVTVPEPTAIGLLALSAGLLLVRRRARTQAGA